MYKNHIISMSSKYFISESSSEGSYMIRKVSWSLTLFLTNTKNVLAEARFELSYTFRIPVRRSTHWATQPTWIGGEFLST